MRGEEYTHSVTEAVPPPKGAKAYFPCTAQEVVTGSIMTDNNGPASSRGAGPMPAWFGDGADAAGAAPGIDKQRTPGFNSTLQYEAVLYQNGGVGVNVPFAILATLARGRAH